MKKAVVGLLGLMSGLVLNSAVQAAPTEYRYDGKYQLQEYLWRQDGTGGAVATADYLIPFATPLSISFLYDPAAPLSPMDPADLAANTDESVFDRGYETTHAITQLSGVLGEHHFSAGSMLSSLYWQTNTYAGGYVSSRDLLSGVFSRRGDEMFGTDIETFSFTHSGENFTLTKLMLGHSGSGVEGVLPAGLAEGLGGPQAHFYFTGDAGSTLYMFNIGTVTAVPVPGAFWLFGSALLAPIALRRRSNKK